MCNALCFLADLIGTHFIELNHWLKDSLTFTDFFVLVIVWLDFEVDSLMNLVVDYLKDLFWSNISTLFSCFHFRKFSR